VPRGSAQAASRRHSKRSSTSPPRVGRRLDPPLGETGSSAAERLCEVAQVFGFNCWRGYRPRVSGENYRGPFGEAEAGSEPSQLGQREPGADFSSPSGAEVQI
jgi:hypothetical protein